MIYDPIRDHLVVFGGVDFTLDFNDVWTMSLGTPQWTQMAPSGTPPHPRQSHSAVYDPVRDRMIVFGGFSYPGYDFYNDVWALSLGATPEWTQLTPSGTPPSARESAAAIYDPAGDRMVFFGGNDNTDLADVWALSLGETPQWTQLFPGGTLPLGRYDHTAIYDPLRARMIVFGGNNRFTVEHTLNDVWALSLGGSPQWTQLTPSGTVPTRLTHSAIYDAARDRMIIFGGGSSELPQYTGTNDVWALALDDPPSWTQLVPLGTPPSARFRHKSTYDPVRDRMIVTFGEVSHGSYVNDVWALDWSVGGSGLASLQCPADAVIPGYSTIPSMSLVGFRITNAGVDPSSFYYAVVAQGPATLVDKGDPLALNGATPILDPGASYYPPEAGLVIPEIRDYAEVHVTYSVADTTDATCTTVIVIEPPVPTLIRAFDAHAVEGGVKLTWDILSDEEVREFKIYRSIENGPVAREISSSALIPSNAKTYTDRSVRGGETYQYTLGVVLADGAVVKSPMVTVKTRAYTLALHQNVPNPFNPITTISFTLPARAYVTVSVYDVAGKRVATLLEGAMDEGYREVVWDGRDSRGNAVSSGVYVCRLSAGTQTVTQKMVLLK